METQKCWMKLSPKLWWRRCLILDWRQTLLNCVLSFPNGKLHLGTCIDYFEIVEEYPKGSTKVFPIPKRPHFTPDQTETSAGGSALFGALPWNVIVIYTHKFDITSIHSAMRAHLRFGHISLDKLHCIPQTGTQTGSVVRIRNTILNCSHC
jgi:hypothetical protein